jgi:Subtilase family
VKLKKGSSNSKFKPPKWSLILLLVVLLFSFSPAVAFADDDDFPDEIIKGELIIRLEAGGNIGAINTKYGTQVLEQITELNLYRLKLAPGTDEYKEWSDIKGESGVRYADFNFVQQAPEGRPWEVSFYGGSDTNPNQTQYAPNLIKAPQAHLVGQGAGVVVAVLDSGIDLDHPKFIGKLTPLKYDFLDNDTSPDDLPNNIDDDADGKIDEGTGHGSHVSGLVLLAAPQASIMPLRVLDSDGRGSHFATLKAIKYATDNGAKIINASLGTYADTESMRELIDYAWTRNVIVVAAAGNENSDQQPKWQYPAVLSKVVAVAATDQNDKKSTFSNFNQEVDISAPGSSLYSAFWNGNYAYWSGTSMATPLVSGGLALLKARFPKFTTTQLIERLKFTATPIDQLNSQYQGKIGSGRLNLEAAMQGSKGKVRILPTPTRIATTQDNQASKLVSTGQAPKIGDSSTAQLSFWGKAGIPNEATGIFGTLTNLNCSGGANFRFWTTGTAPNFNNLNVPGAGANLNLSSGFVTPLDSQGKVYLGLASGVATTCGYIVDVIGYLTGDSNIGFLASPVRLATSQNNQNPKLVSSGLNPTANNSSSLQISTWGTAVPSGTSGIVGVLTNIGCNGGANFRFWTGSTVPNASNLNVPGANAALNLSTNFIAPVDEQGKVYLGLGSGTPTTCGYAVDVIGYIKPGSSEGLNLLAGTVRVATTQNQLNQPLQTFALNPTAANSSTLKLSMAQVNGIPAGTSGIVGVLTNIGCSGGANFRFWTGSIVPNIANLNVPGANHRLNLSTGFVIPLDANGEVYLGLGSGATTSCGYAVDVIGYL